MIPRAIDPDEPLGAANEAQWDRLRVQVDLAEDAFWLGFIFSPSPRSVIVLRERVERLLRAQTKSLLLMQPATPEELRGVLRRLVDDEEPARAGCVWVEAVRADAPGAKERPWTEAWDELFLRGNVRREVLRRRLPGGLVFAAPPEIKPRVREAAPDLWSVRSLVIDLDPVRPVMGIEMEAVGLPMPVPEERGPAPDPAFALAEAARREARGAVGSQASALVQAAKGLIAQGKAREARDAALKAWELLRGDAGDDEMQALTALGIAEAADGDFAAATDHIQRATVLGRQANTGDMSFLYDMAGRLALVRSDLAAAGTIYSEAESIARAQLAKSQNAEALTNLANTLAAVGEVRRQTRDFAGASNALEESLRLYRSASELPGGNPDVLWHVADALTRLGYLRLWNGDLVAAAAALEESATLGRRLYETGGDTLENLNALTLAIQGLANVRRASGDMAAARAADGEAAALEQSAK